MGSRAYLGALDVAPVAAEEPPLYLAVPPKLFDHARTAMRART
jgi:hypothetical protein